MRPIMKNRSSSPSPFVPLRERLDAYWAAIELHAVLGLWIPPKRGIGAARQRIDRAMSQAVMAVGKAANGPKPKSERLLERASDGLDTVLIILDDLTPQGHVTESLRAAARTWIFKLLARLTQLAELPLEQWAATSQPRSAWTPPPSVAGAADKPGGDDAPAESPQRYGIREVLAGCAAEVEAARRRAEPTPVTADAPGGAPT